MSAKSDQRGNLRVGGFVLRPMVDHMKVHESIIIQKWLVDISDKGGSHGGVKAGT